PSAFFTNGSEATLQASIGGNLLSTIPARLSTGGPRPSSGAGHWIGSDAEGEFEATVPMELQGGMASMAGSGYRMKSVDGDEGTVEIIKWAKQQGISITAEVTPHHLLLDDSRLASYDGVNRVNPPLREAADTQALRRALADGVLDCVATDHAPHAEHEKCCEFSNARPGMLGLQTALSVVVQTMVEPGLLDWRGVARVMSENPARIVGLDDQGRPLEVGEPANLVVVDPDATWIVEGRELASRSANTPYASMTLPARVTATLLRGTVTARDGKSPAV
ncbi:MAG TPA: amidohydrolase family protein, partial [Mycobacterium sp.]|nr:amidohydrolase family protein [Mycobacterium sp.]